MITYKMMICGKNVSGTLKRIHMKIVKVHYIYEFYSAHKSKIV